MGNLSPMANGGPRPPSPSGARSPSRSPSKLSQGAQIADMLLKDGGASVTSTTAPTATPSSSALAATSPRTVAVAIDPVARAKAKQKFLCFTQKSVPYIVAIADFVTAIGAGMTVKFFNLFFVNDYKFTPTQITLLQAVYPLCICVFVMILGKLASIFGRAKTSVVSFALNGCCFIVLSQIHKPLWLLLLVFMVRGGLANAVAPLDKSIMTDYTPTTQRGFWNALDSFSSMTWSGSAFIGGILSDKQDYRMTFKVTGFLYLGACCIYSPLLWLVPLEVDEAMNKKRAKEEKRKSRSSGGSANSGGAGSATNGAANGGSSSEDGVGEP